MFVIPCKYTASISSVMDCVGSIIRYHPEEPIVVVDSDSEDRSYFDVLKSSGVTVCDVHNKNYEAGALWHAYHEFPGQPHYVFIHDSLILKKSISSFMGEGRTVAMMYFDENLNSNTNVIRIDDALAYVREVIGQTRYTMETDVIGMFGIMGVYSADILGKLKESGLMTAMRPVDKFQAGITERIMGICLKQEGIDLRVHNIEGNYLNKVGATGNDRLSYFTKRFRGRQ